MSRQPLFHGLIVSESNETVSTTHVGDEAHYVINDDGFHRHVSADKIDRAVLHELRNQIVNHKDIISDSALQMSGQDDLFTKAMIDSSLNNIDDHMNMLLEQGLPSGARQWLGMLGFRIMVNHHGEIIEMSQPGTMGPDDNQ
jgi:hypothetical protein|tara:strand:+ start:457 stop:882 length:426 start_codon:yes stop_codon:yes gene_type:complete